MRSTTSARPTSRGCSRAYRARPSRGSARAHLDEALQNYEAIGDRLGQGNVLWGIGGLYYFTSDVAEAERWYVRSLEHFRAARNRTMEAWALHMLGSTVLKLGRTESAGDMMRHALRHFHEAGDLSGITWSWTTCPQLPSPTATCSVPRGCAAQPGS